MGIIETAINENKEITLNDLIVELRVMNQSLAVYTHLTEA